MLYVRVVGSEAFYDKILNKHINTKEYDIFNLNDTIDDLTPPKSALTEEDALAKAKTVLEKYVKLSDYETPDVGPMPYLLAELGLDTKDNLDAQCLKNPGSDAYIKSNVKYDDFKITNNIISPYFFLNWGIIALQCS